MSSSDKDKADDARQSLTWVAEKATEVERAAEYTVMEMVADQQITEQEATQAMTTHAGQVWQDAMAKAAGESLPPPLCYSEPVAEILNAGLAAGQWQTAVERACRDMIERLAADTPAAQLR